MTQVQSPLPKREALQAEKKPYVKIIEPSKGWSPLNLAELWQYREMMLFLIWRELKVRYKQTILGMLWAIIQPFMTMVVFTFVFDRLARMPSDGVPYPIFSYVGLLPWTFFSNGITKASSSMTGNSGMIKKIYFPRLVLPITNVASGLVDFALGFAMLIILMLYFVMIRPDVSYISQVFNIPNAALYLDTFHTATAPFTLTANVIWLPFLLLLAFITALGSGLWLASLNVRFRDVGYAVAFFTRILLYLTPVAYPASTFPEDVRLIVALNPMSGVIEGFRWALLGVDTAPGPIIIVSTMMAIALLISGAYYFRRTESTFADIV